jgi:hypothetical protein
MVCPFFSKVIHPSSMSFSPVETRLLMVGRAGLSSRSHSLLSGLNTQSSLILRSHKHVRLSGQSRSQLAKSSRPLSLSSSVDVPRCPSEVKPRPWAWQWTLPSSNRTTPWQVSPDTSTSATNPPHESRRKSSPRRGTMPSVRNLTQHALCNREM